MDVKDAYAVWADQYDTNNNRTRDLEAVALRENLSTIQFNRCLEIGCGTGKNTTWLLTKAEEIVAVDLSDEMLAKAKGKVESDNVSFIQADIEQPWTFAEKQFDVVVFSLVLEHIENLESIFQKSSQAIAIGGHIYIGELHPFKQYAGTKARFETEEGLQIVTCYNHHISDFVNAANKFDLVVESINEYFDDNDRANLPRILTLLLKKV